MKPDQRQCVWTQLVSPEKTAPSISFTPMALKWIKAMVDCHETEVGFLGLVNEVNGGYVISEIFYPKHCLANGATCEISPEGDIAMAQGLIDAGRYEDIGKIRMHGHSHVHMETSPSGQDEKLAMESLKTSGSYYIRAICNKKGEMSVSFFDAVNNVKFENVKWTIAFNQEEMLNKVILAINMESNVGEKIKLIRDSMTMTVDYNDDEYKKIVENVKDLKRINLPEEKPLNSRVPWDDGYSGSGPNPGPSYYDRRYGMFDNAFPEEKKRKKRKLLTSREIEAVVEQEFFNAR